MGFTKSKCFFVLPPSHRTYYVNSKHLNAVKSFAININSKHKKNKRKRQRKKSKTTNHFPSTCSIISMVNSVHTKVQIWTQRTKNKQQRQKKKHRRKRMKAITINPGQFLMILFGCALIRALSKNVDILNTSNNSSGLNLFCKFIFIGCSSNWCIFTTWWWSIMKIHCCNFHFSSTHTTVP